MYRVFFALVAASAASMAYSQEWATAFVLETGVPAHHKQWGTDNRFSVDWNQQSLRPIVQITENGIVRCTGTVVARDIVMTAAHCVAEVYSGGDFKADWGTLKIITFDNRPYQVKSVVAPRSEFEGPPPETNAERRRIHLTDVTPDVGFLYVPGIGAHTGSAIVSWHVHGGDSVTLVGFHGDRSQLSMGSCRATVYWSLLYYDRLSHRCTCHSGISGAPLILSERKDKGRLIVVGVQSSADGDSAYASYLGGESGVWRFVRRWIDDPWWG